MRRKNLLLAIVFALLGLSLSQCSTSKIDPYKNTLNADSIIINGGLDDGGSRAQAQSLYSDALNNIHQNDQHYSFVASHANFGLAMIGIWNDLSTISGLIGSNMLSSLTGGAATSSCQPIDLSPYQNLLGPVIDNMLSPIVTNLKAVTQFSGFTFTINSAELVILSDMGLLSSSMKGQSLGLDMSGAYDLGEVDLLLSMFEGLQGGLKLLFAYNGVLNVLANTIIGLTETGCTVQNPLLDPNFGTLAQNGAQTLADAQALLADAAKAFSNSMVVIMARTGDNSNHVFMNYYDNGTCPDWRPECIPTNAVSLSLGGLAMTLTVPSWSIPRSQFPGFTTTISQYNLDPAQDDEQRYSNPWGSTGQYRCTGTSNCTENDHIREAGEDNGTGPGGYPSWEARNTAVMGMTGVSALLGPQDTGYDGLFDYQETGYNPSCDPDPKMFDAFPPNLPYLVAGEIPSELSGTPPTMASGSGMYGSEKPFYDWGTDNTPDQLEHGYRGPDPKADVYDPTYNPAGEEDNGHYDAGEPWGSDILGQLVVIVVKLLPAISPSLASNPELQLVGTLLKGLNQKEAGQLISKLVFVQGLSLPGNGMPLGPINLRAIPPISKLIYLSDFKTMGDELNASITDSNGQHPLDIALAVSGLVRRLVPMIHMSPHNSLSALVPALAIALDSPGGAYTVLPTLPSIDLGAFFSNPPGDLKSLAPLYYQANSPLVGTDADVAPEPFADGFVHVPGTENGGAGYWTSTASLVNGTCDGCTGDPTSKSYGGEWYQDSGDHQWHAGTAVCDATASNAPCFINIYGDGRYHNAGDFISQADEEQAFPSFTMATTALDWSGQAITAYSDTGTDRVADNLELGYDPTNDPDPYGNNVPCRDLATNPLPWPLPAAPQYFSDTTCGEKDSVYDGWDGNFEDLMYVGMNGQLTPIALSPLSALLAPLDLPVGTPFFPRYHFWPNSQQVDTPEPFVFTLPGALIGQPGMFSLVIALPNDSYLFFPDPSFGGLLTVGKFNWGNKFSQMLGTVANGSAPCGTISYATTGMTNPLMNQYVAIVDMLVNLLSGSTSSLGVTL